MKPESLKVLQLPDFTRIFVRKPVPTFAECALKRRNQSEFHSGQRLNLKLLSPDSIRLELSCKFAVPQGLQTSVVTGIAAALTIKHPYSCRRHFYNCGDKMVFICRKVPNSDMILTCIDSYLVLWKAHFDGGVSCFNPKVGRKKFGMSRINLSRLAALAPFNLFAAVIAKPADAQTWHQTWQDAGGN